MFIISQRLNLETCLTFRHFFPPDTPLDGVCVPVASPVTGRENKDDIIKKKKAGYVVLVLYLPDDTGDRNDNAI